ncbi:endonuclease/exonuclease/phosphatase family protein [Ekhidna sp.]
MKIVLLILSIIFIISSIAPLSKREEWWIRGFDFPFVQFTVLGAICIIGWLFVYQFEGVGEGFIVGLLSAFFIYRITVIVPYTSLYRKALPKSEKDTTRLKILSANVLMSNDNYEGFLKVVKDVDADLLLLVEVDQKWHASIRTALDELYPNSVAHPLNNTYGMILYAKCPLKESSIEFLVEEDVPSIHTKIELSSGELIQFYGLHPRPPAPGENDESTQRDAELVVIGRKVKESEIPVIVTGDMNDVAWSHTTRLFMRLSGLLDPRVGRGFFNTFHAQKYLLRWPLDHVFLSHHFRVAGMKRLNNFNSDHFPIFIEVTLNPSTHAIVSKEYADKEDKEEASDKLDKVDI